MLKKLIFLSLFFPVFSVSAGSAWKQLPVQEGGRVKPFDTFARETLFEIYGSDSLKNQQAVEVCISWLLFPQDWNATPLFLIESQKLKQRVGLKVKKRHFSLKELEASHLLQLELSELLSMQYKKLPLNNDFNELKALQQKIFMYTNFQAGKWPGIEPQSNTWLSLNNLSKEGKQAFKKLVDTYLLQKEDLKKEILNFRNKIGVENHISPARFQAEIIFNSLQPFKWSWIFYLVFLILFSFVKKPIILSFFGVGFCFQLAGLFFRSYIMARPPVTNMYETLIWVSFVGLLVGLFYYFRKKPLVFIASLIQASLCLFLLDAAPQILDARLQPLEAVLRSSFWLMTHVLIITMSYSFFFLSMVLGDIYLISSFFPRFQPRLSEIVKINYRLIQWGVVSLAAGTVLGAIWADYSWGRFWAWDPKESWALVSLLAYIALLHGRFTGWITKLSFVVCSVLMFFLIIMAWYGVNFILGAGLHSYGFGGGGGSYVFAFFLLHVLLLLLVAIHRRWIK